MVFWNDSSKGNFEESMSASKKIEFIRRFSMVIQKVALEFCRGLINSRSELYLCKFGSSILILEALTTR